MNSVRDTKKRWRVCLISLGSHGAATTTAGTISVDGATACNARPSSHRHRKGNNGSSFCVVSRKASRRLIAICFRAFAPFFPPSGPSKTEICPPSVTQRTVGADKASRLPLRVESAIMAVLGTDEYLVFVHLIEARGLAGLCVPPSPPPPSCVRGCSAWLVFYSCPFI